MSTAKEELLVLYQDDACICVQKPAGVLTQSQPGIDNLETRLCNQIQRRKDPNDNTYLAIIHRLDRPVSGAIVFCRNAAAANPLAVQFRERSVRKTYWAIVQGRPESIAGTWVDHVRKVPDVARGEIVGESDDKSRRAELSYRVLHRINDLSLVEIELGTGRYHQIRLQFASRKLPVLGDRLYGSTVDFGPEVEDPRHHHIALHARRLSFRNPMMDKDVDVVAPLPSSWEAYADLWESID